MLKVLKCQTASIWRYEIKKIILSYIVAVKNGIQSKYLCTPSVSWSFRMKKILCNEKVQYQQKKKVMKNRLSEET